MGEITEEPHSQLDNNNNNNHEHNGDDGAERGAKRQRMSVPNNEDDEDGDEGRERRKIEIKFIGDKSRRHITFSKRKAGIMKKAYELSVLTGTQVLLLVVSETGLVYTFTTPKLQPLVTKPEGKNLIQSCLNAPEGDGPTNGIDSAVDPAEEEEENNGPAAMGRGAPLVPQGYTNIQDPQAAQQYQAYLLQQQQSAQQPAQTQAYPMPHQQPLSQRP